MSSSDPATPFGGFAIPDDQRYVESLVGSPERDVVAASLLRYRSPERLTAGDPLPAVEVLTGDETLAPLPLGDLVHGRPLVLVFGSYT